MSKSFLQSAEWARFQESVGRKVFWLEKKLVIKHDLPLGLSYFYCPRPEFKDQQELNKFVMEVKKLTKSENAVFIKVEPDINSKSKIQMSNQAQNPKSIIHNTCYILHESKNLQPHDSLLLNLDQGESAILAEMHPKTRYNIRLAEKHGVKIIKSTNVKDIEIFYQLAVKTSQRDKFSYHSKEYYQKMIEILGKNKMVELLIAEIPKSKAQMSNQAQNPNDQNSNTRYKIQDTNFIPIASILVLFYKDTAIYLHGASDHGYRKFMAPYLLQWQAIREAKKRGCKTYDFWGICPPSAGISNFQFSIFNQIQNQNDSNIKNLDIENSIKIKNFKLKIDERHPWAGITRFKLGFAPSGKIMQYPQAFDLIFQPFWYRIYRLAKG